MAAMTVPLPVQHIRNALRTHFAHAIDFSDKPYLSLDCDDPDPAALTRGLAALAVVHLTGCGTPDAGKAVIDGGPEFGIDAVHLDRTGLRLILLQSKWRGKGNATLDLASTLKFREGVKKILAKDVAAFNERFQKKWPEVSKAIEQPTVQITLAVALLGDDPVHPDQRRLLEDFAEEYAPGMMDIQYLHFSDFRRMVRSGIDRPRVDLEQVRVERCTSYEGPYDAYFGLVSADQVAQWYTDHGHRIFTPNIRNSLELNSINRELVTTLKESPEHFWYFNNGITVVAESVERTDKRQGFAGGSGDLSIKGAGIVNGAQTVWAAYRAIRDAPEVAAKGVIGVRFIDCPDDFGRRVTAATNTQNRVEDRDFAALDPVQIDLSNRFPLEVVGRTYTLKRSGNLLPSPLSGCDVEEAALALLCAQGTPEQIAEAKQDTRVLWRPREDPPYRRLFGADPPAHRVWRSVLLTRRVQERITELAQQREGRAASIAEHGRLLIVHLVFQLVNMDGIEDPDTDWDTELDNAADLTELVLETLTHELNTRYGMSSYPLSTFGNSERCEALAGGVLHYQRRGERPPRLPEAYRPKTKARRPNAVPTLVEGGVIEDGTVLEFTPFTGPHRQGIRAWLAADPSRGRATWVNDKSRPLVWSADGERYSPSKLALHMLRTAMGEAAGKAVQGPRYWSIPGRGSLADLAAEVRRAEAEPLDPD